MKKTWVKRENIYYKPFYRHKSKLLLLAIFLLGIVVFIYQVLSINKLPIVSTPFISENRIQSDGGPSSPLNKINATANFLTTGVIGDKTLKIIRGTRLFDFDAYKPNFDGKFRCLDGSKEIEFTKVNDDYCDCPKDGTDEPSTNACSMGKYYCKYQKRHITGRGRDVYVASSRINDGICDCCDGSDEWLTIKCINKCKN